MTKKQEIAKILELVERIANHLEIPLNGTDAVEVEVTAENALAGTELIEMSEAKRLIQHSDNYVRARLASGEIKGYLDSRGRWKISKASVEEYIRRRW